MSVGKKMKSINKCIQEGITARVKGIHIQKCPYSLKSPRSRARREAWRKGYVKEIERKTYGQEKIPTTFHKHSKQTSMPWSILCA